MDDLIVQFARLWGNYEAHGWSKEELELSEKLKGYDSEEMLEILKVWADEYIESEYDDTVEFFEEKIKNLKG
jgi:hypothetical protein